MLREGDAWHQVSPVEAAAMTRWGREPALREARADGGGCPEGTCKVGPGQEQESRGSLVPRASTEGV